MDIDSLLNDGIGLREAEPGIYTVSGSSEVAPYDRWAAIYEAVACNRLYNRIMWGYDIAVIADLCRELVASGDGVMLDAGCGTLAFTASVYLAHPERHAVLLDNSISMLRLAKRRLLKSSGRWPEHLHLLHADATRLPFRDGAFDGVLGMNVLHAVPDAGRLVHELMRVSAKNSRLALTTLVTTGRWSDAYLRRLAAGGALMERDMAGLAGVIGSQGSPGYRTLGNLALVNMRGDAH